MARFGLAVVASLCATTALAGTPSYRECTEGAQFIRNAALSRDAGIARQVFIGRMEVDFAWARTLSAELRWFIKDADDESFLMQAAREVFDQPQAPGVHEGRFLVACAERSLPPPQAPYPSLQERIASPR